MVFVMVYVPCIATLAVTRKELGSFKWPAFMAGFTLVVAWILAVAVFQTARLLSS
jgi:ferrous iron transport protein B